MPPGFPPETAPGPSGLRVQHLKDANVAGGSDAFLSQLTAVVNLLAQGRAPEFLAPVLAGAGLVALPKPQGGVRPIAVGEILRRLTGKCLMGIVRNDAQFFFWPAQVGVAVPGGAEKAIHTVRAWHRRHQTSSDKVALKLDFANAFNTVRRDAVLSAIRDPFPALARWATWCYQRPTRLQFDEWVVESCAGVQQGDPLGPLFFAAALQPLAQDLRNAGLDIAVHYLDDGVVAGNIHAVSAALRLAEARAATIGLRLNLAKSELIAVGRLDIAALHCHFPDALLRAHADGSCRVARNFELLGAAIGEDSFIHSHTVERAAKAGDLLDALGELEDPQVGLRLLRACVGFARMLHSMRCNPSVPQTAALRMFDGMVRRSFGDFTGLHPNALQWKQAALGLGHGGLGLRSTSDHASAAFLASWASALQAGAALDATFCPNEAKFCPELAAALACFNSKLEPEAHITLDDVLSSKQHAMSQRLDHAG